MAEPATDNRVTVDRNHHRVPCGYDVMVAYLLAMQDARVRFPLPAPLQT
jgi:hypothetical protein